MKKLVYSLLVLCSACLLAWACNSMDESVAVTDLEESLNLQAPSGMKIANSMLDLKEFLGKDMDFPMDEFEITDIKYTNVTEGYIAMVTYLLADGAVAKSLYTNWTMDADGRLTPPSLNIARSKSAGESGSESGSNHSCKLEGVGCSRCDLIEIEVSNQEIKYKCYCSQGEHDSACKIE